MRPLLTLILMLSAGHAQAKAPTQFGLPALSRADFNRLAYHLSSTLFWHADSNKNQLLDPDELSARGSGAPLKAFVRGARFTPRLERLYRKLVELRRHEAVRRELDAGRPTVVMTDLRKSPAWQRRVVAKLVKAGQIIDQLYLRQTGGRAHKRGLRRATAADRALFVRNAGPWCSTPATKGDAFCNALPTFPRRRVESYPLDVKQDKAFCEKLQKHPKARTLLDPFTVVRRVRGQLVAWPLPRAFGPEMRRVAGLLRSAAAALTKVEDEEALRVYLLAAAKAFTDNNWELADEAWAAMNSVNSRFYLRIGPDEVYADPCQQKASFHLSLALIDPSSLAWKKKLQPHRDAMEAALARLIGKPYKARKVAFHMPDFIQVMLNAGDSRHPLGATLGQSLPNWGKVAKEGRRRTVVMTNIYTDADSLRIRQLKANALLHAKTFEAFTSDPAPGLLDTILHEAGHNFGPDSDYRVHGKVPKEIFGGGLASTLEELKAQTLSLWYTHFLFKRGVLTHKQVHQGYTNSVLWSFGHISRGMTMPSGQPKPYSRLSAIQMGWLMDHGALVFERGKFRLHFKKVAPAINALMREVGRIKAHGNKKAGQALVARYISPKALSRLHFALLQRELLKYPKAAFGYAIAY
ncbi:MAG: hypothetical protein JRH20_12405 [Deltaproteobacteria bacterium]|nr:hypothetical protein [Deltaproteobacteria bacterium]